MTIRTLLVANRGEIACRVIRTAKRLGIRTVAVHSAADTGAPHVAMADQAVLIGPAPVGESYLSVERILGAVAASGADAVHPGYGFLSENAGFASACADAGLTFVGPPVEAIDLMGDKARSKLRMIDAGVPCVPGYQDAEQDDTRLLAEAERIGFPLMVKASAGGGGRGMRLVDDPAKLERALKTARSEAKNAFGDDRLILERAVVRPRHVEIQVFADSHGNVIHLGERDCSVQRRHQKVIEEAPSPFLDEATRKAMGEQACTLANAVDYQSAGTVEFIVDKNRNFYFLEMNTRLQVEHPVTELITGIDLVEWMIRVANGEKLTMTQDDIKLTGWAVESRIYAEDPYRGFLPSIGRLSRFAPPAESATVRVDTGVVEGSEITMFYDPMIAKLCSYGPDRKTAIDNMVDALNQFRLEGISHNINFVNAVCNHPRFREGRLSTNFIPEEYPDGFEGAAIDDATARRLVAVAVLVHLRDRIRATGISDQVPHFRPRIGQDWHVEVQGATFDVRATAGERATDVHVDGEHLVVESNWRPGKPVFDGIVGGKRMSVQIRSTVEGFALTFNGATNDYCVRTPMAGALAALMPVKEAPDLSKLLLCPMPGMVMQIHVEVGDEVKTGQALAVVEAMKMENVLRAEADGVVASINASAGDSLAVDDIILELE